MNEEDIVNQLKENLPEPYKTDVVPGPTPDTTNGQATSDAPYKLDELSQYKLHDYFGAHYRETDETSRSQIEYIYETIGRNIGSADYLVILNKIREVERIAGISHSENRIYRLYQWLKLDNVRRRAEGEMNILGDSA